MSIKAQKLAIFIASFLTAGVAQAIPSSLTFDNQTSLALATSISGIPGSGVAPNAKKSAPYTLMKVACYASGNMTNCPISFSDKSTGEIVATVSINAETATLLQAPTLFGDYANEYEIRGWDQSPVTEITITKKV